MSTNQFSGIFYTPSEDQAHQVAMRVLDHVRDVAELLGMRDKGADEYADQLARIYVSVFNYVLSGEQSPAMQS